MPLDVVPRGIAIAAVGGLAIGRGVFRRMTAAGLAALATALGVSLALGAW